MLVTLELPRGNSSLSLHVEAGEQDQCHRSSAVVAGDPRSVPAGHDAHVICDQRTAKPAAVLARHPRAGRFPAELRRGWGGSRKRRRRRRRSSAMGHQSAARWISPRAPLKCKRVPGGATGDQRDHLERPIAGVAELPGQTLMTHVHSWPPRPGVHRIHGCPSSATRRRLSSNYAASTRMADVYGI